MEKHPLERLKDLDAGLSQEFHGTRALAFAEGAIPMKYKTLIALALDAADGAVDGVRFLATKAMEEGASKEEILETLRVAYHIGGGGVVYTAMRGLPELEGEGA